MIHKGTFEPFVEPLRDTDRLLILEMGTKLKALGADWSPETLGTWMASCEVKVLRLSPELNGDLSASDSHRPIGFLIFHQVGPQTYEILAIGISPEHQRQGLGRVLLEQVVTGGALDAEWWLEVHERNIAAQRLYDAAGFKRTGIRSRYYKDGKAAFLYSRLGATAPVQP
jgi:ribosomal protein S18 acetylase RimI-like enzyme